ncbi:MAG: DUF6132 family protein [Flavobacteriales bacterium]
MKRTWIVTAIGAVLGAVGGWCYWHFVGCSSGTCAITSHPLNSSLYGTFMGGLLANSLAPDARKRANDTPN